jgi:hypothetical protein
MAYKKKEKENAPVNNSAPSSPADREKLKVMLEEIVHAMRRADDEKVSIKEIKDEIKKQFGIAPKYSGKMAKTMYKHEFDLVKAENSEFEELYEQIIGGDGNFADNEED